jgi:hypothetical protein
MILLIVKNLLIKNKHPLATNSRHNRTCATYESWPLRRERLAGKVCLKAGMEASIYTYLHWANKRTELGGRWQQMNAGFGCVAAVTTGSVPLQGDKPFMVADAGFRLQVPCFRFQKALSSVFVFPCKL